MEYSLLGPTGVKVSKICLGTATFGVAPDAQEAGRVVHAALDRGINFDTANVYGATPTFDRPGAPPATEREPAEQILGRALAGSRDDVMIATKSGERRFDPAWAVAPLHHPPGRTQLAPPRHRLHRPLLRALPRPRHPAGADPHGLRRSGAARKAALRGLSNHPAWQVTQALWIADDRHLAAAPVCAQVKLQPHRPPKKSLPQPVSSSGCPSPFGPLHGGLLAGMQVEERELR